MHVAHFNTYVQGGAAIAARRIHDGLQGFRSTIVSSACYHRSDDSSELAVATQADQRNTSALRAAPFEPNRLNKITSPLAYRKHKQRQYRIFDQFNLHLADRSSELESFSMAELPIPTRLPWTSLNADIVHLHWVAHLIDYPSFFTSIPVDVPIVWTLHDMNPVTGGCHYSDQCLRYRFGCGSCPQVLHPQQQDVSRSTWLAKQAALADRQVTVVAPSNWLLDQARLSPVWPASADCQLIRYGLDLNQFSPMGKQQARRELGIESDAVLVGFGAADVNAPRKGMSHLIHALQKIEADNRRDESQAAPIELVVLGTGNFTNLPGLPQMHSMGFVESLAQQRRIYSAMDLIVVPSREDNQPQVGLEAMACGTPVVGFASGGIPEYVRDQQTGLLVAPGDDHELAGQIRKLASDSELRTRLGGAARKMMEQEFEMVRQSERYIELYQSVLRERDSLRSKPRRAG